MKKLTRRQWLTRGSVVGLGLLGWTSLIEPRWLSITYSDLAVPNLPQQWVGKRLVHVTDMHCGKVAVNYLQHCIQVVNSFEPDLLVFTGDFIDHTGGMNELKQVLEKLQPAKVASLGCLGNHDYGRNWRQRQVADRVVDIVNRFGIHILRNESKEWDGLRFYGLEDYWSPSFGADSILQTARNDQASLCLCHNPDVCDLDVWGSFRGMVLSGHTHGGQCKPPFLPPPLLPVVNRRYTSGFFKIDEDRTLFISRGVGHTMRVRFNCRPEIAVFRLKDAS